jgi:outer membrane protein OmpA-like peptidoglycan-associated protein
MRRSITVIVASAFGLGILSGCASKPPPPELQDARAAYARAQSGAAARGSPSDLVQAREALDGAEKKYAKDPGSEEVKTLAYVATRKAESAESGGRAAKARAQQEEAEKALLRTQTAQAESEAGKQKQAAGIAERRAKVALGRLGLAAKDEPRGTVITIPGESMFATNKAEILPAAKAHLTEIANGIKKVLAEGSPLDKGRKVQLIGHTDNVGSDQHNLDLSKRRAEAVRAFFVAHGIDAAMTEADGRGEAEPVASNETREGRANNRRVEVVITPVEGGEGMPPPEKPEGEK